MDFFKHVVISNIGKTVFTKIVLRSRLQINANIFLKF